MKVLNHILTHKRGHESVSERRVVGTILDSIKGMQHDGFGNRFIRVGGATPTTMFSCHTDTVHHTDGRQIVLIDPSTRIMYKEDNECLGADDGAGMWLMVHMIRNKIPGLYVFHRGEERGGLGSKWIVTNNPSFLTGIKHAIAFDRRGTKDIITHQRRGKCASDDFAKALAGELNMGHYPSTMGSFTDTANYIPHIRECTNVSIGYESEHRGAETLDLNYLEELSEAVLKVKWDQLPEVRATTDTGYTYGGYGGYGGYDDWDDNSVGSWYGRRSSKGGAAASRSRRFLTQSEIASLVINRPELAAIILKNLNVQESDYTDAVRTYELDKAFGQI